MGTRILCRFVNWQQYKWESDTKSLLQKLWSKQRHYSKCLLKYEVKQHHIEWLISKSWNLFCSVVVSWLLFNELSFTFWYDSAAFQFYAFIHWVPGIAFKSQGYLWRNWISHIPIDLFFWEDLPVSVGCGFSAVKDALQARRLRLVQKCKNEKYS